MYEKATANIILNGDKLKAYPLNFSEKKKNPSMPTLTTIIQQSFGGLSQGNKRRKRKKRNPNQKRRTKTVTVYR